MHMRLGKTLSRFLVSGFVAFFLIGPVALAASEADLEDLPGFNLTLPGQPGVFDYYVLALSWSPAFCESLRTEGQTDPQCKNPGLGFVVHGLWPQFRSGGYPAYCNLDEASVDESLLGSWPSDKLELPPEHGDFVAYEWSKHGTCTGLDQEDYFNLLKKAVSEVRVPESFLNGVQPLNLEETDLMNRFLEVNPAFFHEQMRVLRYREGRISDLLLCFDKSLRPMPCE
jgi:ribonuclease T2